MNPQSLPTRGVGITVKPQVEGFWATKAPLWMIAISLFTIACCLVLLVVRTVAPDDKPQASANTNQAQTVGNKTAYRRTPPNSEAFRPRDEMLVLNRDSLKASTTVERNDTILADSSPARPAHAVLITDPRPPAPTPVAGFSSSYPSGIKGTVYLKGEAPAETVIDVGDTPCAEPGQAPRVTRFFVTGTNGGLADTLVFISGGWGGNRYPASQDNLELTFTNCLIEPYMSAVMVGARLVARDATGLSHQLRFVPSNGVNPQPLFGQGMVELASLTGENLVRLSCDVHPWESAFVSSFRHPYFALTDERGEFSITNVPAGQYTIEARHPSRRGGFERVQKSLKVTPKETATADLEISAKF